MFPFSLLNCGAVADDRVRGQAIADSGFLPHRKRLGDTGIKTDSKIV